jgi:exopolyphosphatase / guanosine-5'-triphosphate,3'-diphosphate pyrophosphatase
LAKRVAVIDIGSNSVRMVIYEKTSRFAFHLLHEAKSRVRISEHAYQNGGNLQEIPMQRTFDALADFTSILSSFKVTKTLCVATSALRDAPNKQEFIQKVRNNLKLNIKVIDGEKEAYYGAIACANLLPQQNNALSIDIGGGSTELTCIDKNSVTNTISLDLGTVRLKELYFDNNDLEGAIKYIDEKLEAINNLSPSTIIGIGGTFRALSNAIMLKNNYPLDKLHAYECLKDEFLNLLSLILSVDESELKKLNIKSNRFDVIKPGALILDRLFHKLSINNIITSGVGVREGVYLADLLRNSKDKFPHNYNTSVRYIIDSSIQDTNFSNQLSQVSKKLFDLTYEFLNIDKKFRYELAVASKLYPAGSNIHFYSQNKHSYYLIKGALEYGFTHRQIVLISTLTRYAKNKLPSQRHLEKYKDLLPEVSTVESLSYLISLGIALLSHKPKNIDFEMKFEDGILKIVSDSTLYLSKEAVKKLTEIKDFKVEF